jgi:hypothetical protein
MTDRGTELDQVWQTMLEEPGPPMPTAREALTVARTASRRRLAAVAGAGLAGTVAVAVAAVTAGMALAGTGRTTPALPDPPAAAPASATVARPLPVAPSREAAHAHGKRNGAILTAAVPAGYTGVLQNLGGADSPAATWQLERGTRYVSTVDVVVTTGRADGMLSVSIQGGVTGVHDLCAKAVSDYLSAPPGCHVVSVDGVPIRLVSTHDDRGEVTTAIRLLDGGFLTVEAQQGIPAYHGDGQTPPDAVVHQTDHDHTILGGWPPLPAVPLSTAQVAALATNPGLLP